MIAQLRGRVLESTLGKDTLILVVDVQGVGYEVHLTKGSQPRVSSGQAVTLYVSESVTAFDGATTLYGFLNKEEKDFFNRLRDSVDGMGPKKALESMDKINKSMPDFKRAIVENDQRLLVSVFGFTKKTSEKLIFSLKDKIDSMMVSGAPKWADESRTPDDAMAMSGLINMGYREDEARELMGKAKDQLGPNASADKILEKALKLMGSKI